MARRYRWRRDQRRKPAGPRCKRRGDDEAGLAEAFDSARSEGGTSVLPLTLRISGTSPA